MVQRRVISHSGGGTVFSPHLLSPGYVGTNGIIVEALFHKTKMSLPMEMAKRKEGE